MMQGQVQWKGNAKVMEVKNQGHFLNLLVRKVQFLPFLANLLFCFVWFDSLRPLNNLSVMRDGSSWNEPVLS